MDDDRHGDNGHAEANGSSPHRLDAAPTDLDRAGRQATWLGRALYVWPADAADAGDVEHLDLRLPDGEARVAARRLRGGEMLAVLENVVDGDADSLRGLSKLLEFVKGAVAREQFYPSANRDDVSVVASWRVLIADERDVERLETFAAALPGACFCADAEKADRLESVEAFLNGCCDAVVRRSLSNDDFFANVHDRAADRAADAEVRWVSALVAQDADAPLGDRTRAREVDGRPVDVAELLDKVQAWTARLGDAGGEPWRLGVVLEEPPYRDPVAAVAAEKEDEPKTLLQALADLDDDEDEEEEEVAEAEAVASTDDDDEEGFPAPPDEVDEVAAADDDARAQDAADDVAAAEDVWPLRLRLMPPADLEETHVALSARQVWEQPAGSIGFVGRNAVRLRERLASEMQRAADLCPPMRRALDERRPEELSLSTAEAFRFIRDWAEGLREAGIDVQLPHWAGSKQSRVEVVMNLRPLDGSPLAGMEGGGRGFDRDGRPGGLGSVGLDHLLSFDWKIAVGGESLDAAEFQRLVAQQQPLVRRDGQWVEIDPEAARAAAQLMHDRPPGTLTLGEAFRVGFGLGRGADLGAAAPAVRLAGTRWVEELLEQTPDAKAKAIPQPAGFLGEMRPYQLRGLQWMAFLDRLGLGGILADDMGLGKTIQLISLLLYEKESRPEGAPAHPTLLFVPTSVLGNWQREVGRFAPALKTMLHHGPQRMRGEEFHLAAEACDVVITSYALSHRDQADLRAVTWGRVALDEAQKIKNPTAASSVAVRSIDAPRRVTLTGTPVENHLGELWSIMDLLNPGLLGTSAQFREKFANPIEKQGDRGRARRLREMIRPFILRRTKDDPDIVGDLPAKMEMNVYTGLTGEQAAMYEKITGEMLGRIDTATGIRRRGLILSVLTKLKQVCDHPALVDDSVPRVLNRSGKAQRISEMLEEVIDEGEKALIFTQYRQMGDMLVEMLEKRLNRKVLFLHGGTPQQKRDEMVQNFQTSVGPTSSPVFLLSLRAGGLGLNLTAASHVFHFDRWWNPAVENQATDRAHRIGQVRRVQVHKFVSLGTVEERIDKMLQEKSQLAANIVGSGDDWLTELSTTELKEYLSLSREALTDGAGEDDDE